MITAGKADPSKPAYVSIQAENKPGLYITANDDKSATLAQDVDGSEETFKKQTFHTMEGLSDKDGVSFESVSQPGQYLTVKEGELCLTDGSEKAAATFFVAPRQ